jgi:hypothetical protein
VKTIEADLDALMRDGEWVLVWKDSVEVHRSHFRERPDAEAYAAKHGGVLVQMWPRREDAAVGNILPN